MNFTKSLLVGLFLAPVSSLFAQVSLKPPFQDFGNFRPGTQKIFKVKITNNSGVTLALSNTHADCECITAKLPVEVLKPKAFTWLTIQYNPSKAEMGWKAMEVSFDYKPGGKSAGQVVPTGMADFHLTANLIPETYQDPATINATSAIPGKAAVGQGEFYLDPKVYSHWKLGRAQSDQTQFSASMGALPTPGYYRVTVQAPVTTLPGHYKGSVFILGATQKDKSFTYPFQVNVASHWIASPAGVTFGSLAEDKIKNWKFTTRVQFDKPKAFKILKMDGAPDWLKYDVQYQKPSNCVIQWRVDDGLFKKDAVKKLPDTLKVVTDQDLEPFIILPTQSEPAPVEKKQVTKGPRTRKK